MITRTREEVDQLKVLAASNISELLDKLEISYSDNFNNYQGICPCEQHGGDRDNATAFSYSLSIGRWICFTHHCQEKFGSDAIGLVRSVLGLSFLEACDWIEENIKSEGAEIGLSPIKRSVHSARNMPISETNIKFLVKDYDYLVERGFDPQVLEKHEVGYWFRPGTFMHQRMIFPIRDENGRLIGYSGRTVKSKSWFESRDMKYNKWLHGRYYHRYPVPGDFNASAVLYNFNNAKRYTDISRKVIIVEGPLDGMKLDEAGVNNWCSTLSTNFSESHRSILMRAGVTDLYFAYDNDDPSNYENGVNPAERSWSIIEEANGDLFNLHKVELPAGKDCGDLSVNEAIDIFYDISQ